MRRLKVSAKIISNLPDKQNLEVWVAATKKRCGALQEKESLDKCYRLILREAVQKMGTKVIFKNQDLNLH